jgi:LysR family transcriptional regulator, transcriptional activator of the cysJI operon
LASGLPRPKAPGSGVAVNEYRSFTRAADSLNLTQAAVSQHLQRLESELGQLLIRRPRKVELTPAGQLLLAYAKEVDIASTRLRSRLANDDPHSGEISISSPGSIGLALYPRLLALQVENPGLSIRYRFAPTDDIIAAVLDNRFELGLVTRLPQDERLIARLFAREHLCLVLPADGKDDSWPALRELGFIGHPDGKEMATRLFSRRYPGERFDHLPVRGFTNQIAMILEPVALGLGFTVLPRFAVDAYPNQQRIRIAGDGPVVIDNLWLIHRAEWPVSAPAALAMETLAAEMRKESCGG